MTTEITWVSAATPPPKNGIYLVHATSADPESPLIRTCPWYEGRFYGLPDCWLPAIKHWAELPKTPES